MRLPRVPIFTARAQAQVGKYSVIFVPARSGPSAFRVFPSPHLHPLCRLSMTQSPLDTLAIFKAGFSNVFMCRHSYFIFILRRMLIKLSFFYLSTYLFGILTKSKKHLYIHYFVYICTLYGYFQPLKNTWFLFLSNTFYKIY